MSLKIKGTLAAIEVTVVWMENGAQVGARLCFNGNADRLLNLFMDDIRQHYAGKLSNTDITSGGGSVMQGKVSMVMPCYNKVKYIGEMFDSIIAQDWDNIELILVNDGATDGTREVIAQYAPRFRGRGFEVVIIDQANAGVCAAAKAGLERITGDYVCMVDADDELDPRYVSTMAGWLESNESYDLAACAAARYKHYGTDKVYARIHPEDIPVGDPYLVERFMLGFIRATVWIYMLRVSYLHKCRIIETYYTKTHGSHEPGYVIPIHSYGGKLKYFSLPLYRFNNSGEGHSQFKNYAQAQAFYDEYDKLCRYAISVLPNEYADMQKKTQITNISRLSKLFALYGNVERLPGGKDHIDELRLGIVAEINRLMLVSPPIRHEQVIGMERFLIWAVKDILVKRPIITPRHPKGRIIGWGVLGKNGRALLPFLDGTTLAPSLLWDSAGDGVTVDKPDITCLSADDLVLIFPSRAGDVVEIEAKLADTGCSFMQYSDIVAFIMTHAIPQLYAI